MSNSRSARSHRTDSWLLPVVLAPATALAIGVPGGLGLMSLPGLGIAALVGGTVLLLLLYRTPWALVVLVPALLPSPMMFYTFAWELALSLLLVLVVVYGIRERANWLYQLSSVELICIAFVSWGLFSGLWCWDLKNYLIGVRHLILTFATLWLGLRLRYVAPRQTFEWGLIAGSTVLACAALGRRVTTGFSAEQALLRRSAATDLGWGTANFIATLLLVLAPMLLALALHASDKRTRTAAWIALALNGLMQMVIASRAAAALLIVGLLIQLFVGTGRRRLWPVLSVVGLLGVLLASPLGTGFYTRLTSARELGSMTIRIWYMREGWRRLLDNLPWGLGLGQGYVYADKLQGTDPHNYWLVIGGDLGAPGILLWLALLIVVARGLNRITAMPQWRPYGRALQIAFWMSQFHSLVEPTFQGTQYPFIFFWAIGGALGYYTADRHPLAAASSRA